MGKEDLKIQETAGELIILTEEDIKRFETVEFWQRARRISEEVSTWPDWKKSDSLKEIERARVEISMVAPKKQYLY